jgi:hypothetical protein
MGAPAASRAAVDALLEACLSAYAAHPADTEVYTAFKGVVEVAGVSSGELVAAMDGLRAVAARLTATLRDAALLKGAVRTSAVSGATGVITGAFDALDAVLVGSELDDFESGASGAGPGDRAAHARDVAEAAKEVDAALPPAAGLAARVGILLSLARERLLLLEAVSLSPTLSWALVFANGLHPAALRLLAGMAATAGVVGDLDTGKPPRLTAGRASRPPCSRTASTTRSRTPPRRWATSRAWRTRSARRARTAWTWTATGRWTPTSRPPSRQARTAACGTSSSVGPP